MGIAIATKTNIKQAAATAGPRPAGAPEEPGAPLVPDDTLAKIVKLIPGEVVAFYLSISTFLVGSAEGYQFAVFLIGLIATPTVMWLAARPPKNGGTVPLRPPPLQYVLRTVAFVLWATATAYPFLVFGKPLDPKVIGIALATFTLFAPFAIRE